MNGINRVNGGVLVAISFNMQLEAGMAGLMTVSYTHLTLPTNREV